MLINSVLSDVPCVKVRKGMMVVVTERERHGFPINSICKVINLDPIDGDEIFAELICNTCNYSQWLGATQFRLADSTEKRLYRKQLKQTQC